MRFRARSSLLMDRSVITRVIIRAATIRYMDDALSRSMDIEMQIGLLIDRLDLWPASDLKSLRWARVWFMRNSWLLVVLLTTMCSFSFRVICITNAYKGEEEGCLHACLIWGNETNDSTSFPAFSTVYDTVSYRRRNFKVFQALIRVAEFITSNVPPQIYHCILFELSFMIDECKMDIE